MNTTTATATPAPRWVTIFNPIAKSLLRAGVPLGYNGLLTVPGRRSGQPRTTPIAIIESGGRRWVWAPWGDVLSPRVSGLAPGEEIVLRARTPFHEATASFLASADGVVDVAVQAPIAAALRSGATPVPTAARVLGTAKAAANPCKARPASSAVCVPATAMMQDATPNSANPTIDAGRAPNRSAAWPPSTMKAAATTR